MVFITALVIFVGIVGLVGLPLWFVAGQRFRWHTIRNYAVSGLVVALLCAFVEVATVRAEEQCAAAGNPTCYDPGGPGLQMVMVGVYLVANWATAYLMWRE